ncbi:MAG: Plug domain-containing protein, partial [Pseudomonadales bacterium]|nr:Plug domain-containing protein [Pseudomonadales bacterium]
MKHYKRTSLGQLCLVPVALTAAIQQTAQAAEDPIQGIEEIVVSARYIDESARDLPFSVSVVDGEIMERARLFTLEDTLRTSVGVDVSSFGGFNDTNVRMRGVGSLFTINAEDSSVVMNIDNVPLSARSAS